MNEQALTQQVLRIINSNYSNIYVIDIPSDIVYTFTFSVANELIIKEKTSYTEFIEFIPKIVNKDDLSNYFSVLSINALEDAAKKGNSETKVKFRKLCETGEYRWFQNIVNYLPFENKKLIFMMSEDVNDRLVDVEENNIKLENKVNTYKDKIKKENESISEALNKVNYLLDNSRAGNLKTRDTKNAISSIFGELSVDNPELGQAIRSKMANETIQQRESILIVDDSSIIRNSLKRIFQKDYEIIMAKDGNEAIELLATSIESKRIVGVLLDLFMPECNGFAVLDFMKENYLFEHLPVAIISGDESIGTRKKVYEYDISDMLEKPFNTEMIRRRIEKIIKLHQTSNDLQHIINKQTEAISSIDTVRIEKLESIMKTVIQNICTSNESIKLQKWVRVLALNLANSCPEYGLTNDRIDSLITTCPLYNVGAITLSSNTVITNKVIQDEIENGIAMASLVITNPSELDLAMKIIKNNCELYDGSGYPNGIKGDAIPIESQIVTTLVRLKEYSKIKSFNQALKHLEENESNKYNPKILEALKNVKNELKEIEE